ncbi:VC_2705 family sodium/solute symporter [Bordetella sp. 15P40C-2]|uniref:VC_2705 family sodium/solute symporter n=1 Tax=Bordetella sp. 15P40C-2 TaxID=2572246 RepID=UPI00132BB8E2|nr:VC_2705 family sodium/solute symporter [Bordetella sp. 15P40C-2]MVW73567.1 cation acetate symporter [Bordetella sp. 15P40C-2]
MPFTGDSPREFDKRLRRIYVLYTAGFALLIVLLALAELAGLPRNWIGYAFLLVTVSLYAGIGIVCRTSDQVEYYVAGRRVPAVYNGMATAADWMSVASFIGVAGTLYLTGYGGLAYIMGWTGGYVLVALLLAPYLRKFGQYTLPDFMGARYGGNLARLAGVACAVLCSFTYLVAQIYGVGIITTRMTGISFELGIFVALGGMLVCSFLGGMRAVTWTQVGQYIILVVAYLVPVIWLSMKHTDLPLPQLAGGTVLQEITERETQLGKDVSELQVRQLWKARADEMTQRLEALPESWSQEKDRLRQRLAELTAIGASMVDVRTVERELETYPESVEAARAAWSQARATFEARGARPVPHAEPFPAADPQERQQMRLNFLSLVLCLMLGTAGMPHILMRSYTTRSVIEARRSVCWSLLFILLLYFMAPALALLVKYEVYTQVVGSDFAHLPSWVHAWSAVDVNLLDLVDVNRDGKVQLGEISMGADVVVLAMPEIGGLPYVISGLVAAGGLAAALSTADGLLLTLSNSLSHDMWYRVVSPRMSAARRVMVSKILLLAVAFAAAWVAARKPADILFMVSAAFSFAASSFFPALVMGIFWRRANKWGAVFGMGVGLAVTFTYMAHTHPWLREWVFGIDRAQPVELWWGIQPIAAGVFGAPAAFLTMIVVSLLTPPPDRATNRLVHYLREPDGKSEA